MLHSQSHIQYSVFLPERYFKLVRTIIQVIISALSHCRGIVFKVSNISYTFLKTLRITRGEWLLFDRWPQLWCDSVSLLLNRCHCHLALQKITITTYNFSLVEGLVLMHFLFHQVLHDTRIKVSTLLLIRSVYLFRIVHQEFGAGFLERFVSASSYSSRTT